MNTLLNKGRSIEVVAPTGGYTSGQPVLVGSLVGISADTYAAGQTAVIWLTGTHLMAKAVGAITQGTKLYWDATNNVVTTTATNNTMVGYAWSAQASGDASVYVLLRQ